jgi:hypothetical protein
MRSCFRASIIATVFLQLAVPQFYAQTTQGTITGRVFDRSAAEPLEGAAVIAYNADNRESGRSKTNKDGFYAISLLSPGTYRVRAEKSDFQAQEIYNLDLPVASQLDISFNLRPVKDLFSTEANRLALVGGDRIIPFFGEDTNVRLMPVDVTRSISVSLAPTVSNVISSDEIESLPLQGRDVYAILALQGGVTSDAATGRGLGLSVNGQRPAASNFLLDGLQNNNNLVTGPLLTIAPEAIQEYRFSTNSFSAEYGRTAGFIANAVTRQGSNSWHATGYMYFKHDHLNANDFERNVLGYPVNTLRQSEPGITSSGPLIANRLYISVSGDYLHFRSNDPPQAFTLPTDQYPAFVGTNTIARSLLSSFSFPLLHGAPGQTTGVITIAPPSSASVDQWLGLLRLDALLRGGKDRLTVRPIAGSLNRPNFLWTPYQDFTTPLRQTNIGVSLGLVSSFGRTTNEAHFGFTHDDLGFDRRWPGIPSLSTYDGTTLPGSPAYYSFKNQGRNLEVGDQMILSLGSSLLRIGGNVLLRWIQGYLTAGRDSLFVFNDFSSFAKDEPFSFLTSVSRASPTRYVLPEYPRNYRYAQFSFFLDDSIRVNSRLSVDLGIRYEGFGAPWNTGTTKDALVKLGSGLDIQTRLQGAKLVFPGPGDQQLYDTDYHDVALRAGFAYAIHRKGDFLLRGSFGVFYDPPFDNLWENIRNNNFTTTSFIVRPPMQPLNYLQPILNILSGYVGLPYSKSFPNLVLYQPGLRNGYAENFFLGVQKRFTAGLTVELNGLGSLGRRLVTSDLVNRYNSLTGPSAPLLGQFAPSLPEMSYRGSQGMSDYTALSIVARYRRGRALFQLAYTLSHAIDNQSDPLAGDFFNLDFTQINSGNSGQIGPGFTRQFDSHGDRANADFDQRHDFVGYATWDLPAWTPNTKVAPLFRNWTVSAVGAARSGFPFSVLVPPAAGSDLVNNRADIVAPNAVYASGTGTVPGTQRWLNPSAFQIPPAGLIGNSGRNAFRGPGLYSLDFALSRSFPIKIGASEGRLMLRADAFNVLNHANLNNPDSFLTSGSSTFGLSTFGRMGQTSGFPAQVPFNETARQIQLMVKLEF